MKRKFLCAILALGVTGLSVAAPPECTHDDLTKLVGEWKKADWREWFRVGHALSQCLVADDVQYFRVMVNERQTFDGWLLGLGGHTFMYSDPAEKPKLEKLKETMVGIAERASSSAKYGELAKALRKRLETVAISEAPKIAD